MQCFHRIFAGCLAVCILFSGTVPAAQATGWLNWRGPNQNGVSNETGLPDSITTDGQHTLWTYDLFGRGSAVIANGRVYAFGYNSDDPELQEVLACIDAATGKKIWERTFEDFLSDIVYNRYSIGAPTVDAETGNIYVVTASGLFVCVSPENKIVWQHSLMEELGRLTFPNGRNGSPIIDGDFVITHYITNNWGAEGAPMDRFYAFNKKTGELVWSSTPGSQPKDNSMGTPVLAWNKGRRVFYCGTGDGNIVCVNARNGVPLWRFPISRGGVNASVVLHGDSIIASHHDENLDTSDIGRTIAVRIPAEDPKSPQPTTFTVALPSTAEIWRSHLSSFSSSPVIVGDNLYMVEENGLICCVDAKTGKLKWEQKLAPDQLHASSLFADGKLYVPMQDGSFYVIKPSETGAQILSRMQLEGNCLGAPTVSDGRIILFTTKKLYCFGNKGDNPAAAQTSVATAEPSPTPGPAARLQVIPAEVLLRTGQSAKFRVRSLDANGFVVSESVSDVKWAKYIPPTARVKATLDGDFNAAGELVAGPEATLSAGAFEATAGGLKGYMRARILPNLPFKEDFEAFKLTQKNFMSQDFAYPPLPWIGARFKWEVRNHEGSNMLVKTTENAFLMRATSFIGDPASSNYTMEADVMSDGNRRTLNDVGLINQRYNISLLGNAKQLQITSNQERIKVVVPFPWQPKIWYHLKTRVDTGENGAGIVRAKAWKRGDPEPEAWTLEAPVRNLQPRGAPGIFGFSIQNMFPIYIDNISVVPNPTLIEPAKN